MCVGIIQLHEQTNVECISLKYLSLILSLSPSFLHICFLHSVKPPQRWSETVSPQFEVVKSLSFLHFLIFFPCGLKGRGKDDLIYSTIVSFVSYIFISFWPCFALIRVFSESDDIKKNVSHLSVNSMCRLLIVPALSFSTSAPSWDRF